VLLLLLFLICDVIQRRFFVPLGPLQADFIVKVIIHDPLRILKNGVRLQLGILVNVVLILINQVLIILAISLLIQQLIVHVQLARVLAHAVSEAQIGHTRPLNSLTVDPDKVLLRNLSNVLLNAISRRSKVLHLQTLPKPVLIDAQLLLHFAKVSGPLLDIAAYFVVATAPKVANIHQLISIGLHCSKPLELSGRIVGALWSDGRPLPIFGVKGLDAGPGTSQRHKLPGRIELAVGIVHHSRACEHGAVFSATEGG
jgi:hypothetical protein